MDAIVVFLRHDSPHGAYERGDIVDIYPAAQHSHFHGRARSMYGVVRVTGIAGQFGAFRHRYLGPLRPLLPELSDNGEEQYGDTIYKSRYRVRWAKFNAAQQADIDPGRNVVDVTRNWFRNQLIEDKADRP